MSVDEWRCHEDTVELASLISASVDQTEDPESENEDCASSGSEQLDDADEEDNDDNDDDDNDDDDVPFTALSSRNPFELLDDNNQTTIKLQ